MCKDPDKLGRAHRIMKFISFICFGIFGIMGGGFYTDYMVNERKCDVETNNRETPDCYPTHFFGVGWLMMASAVPFFGIFGECHYKVTLIGAFFSFIAGCFGLYFVIMVFVDREPFNIFNDQEPREKLGHGCVLIGEGLRSTFELIAMYLEGYKHKAMHA